jgi:mannose-6-phosphate isomerase-like protein (cupin superfamily)
MSDITIKADHLPIYRLEQAIREHLPLVEMQVDNDFCDGMYARTLHIPAGTIATGAVHKKECFFTVRSGLVVITTDDDPIQVGAGYMAITRAGTKRVAYAIEDTVITTFHPNPDGVQDQDALWKHFTEPAPDNLLEILGAMELEGK